MQLVFVRYHTPSNYSKYVDSVRYKLVPSFVLKKETMFRCLLIFVRALLAYGVEFSLCFFTYVVQ
jgi:hypothetical protein